ncbi:structural maintenance of chromosomes protein 5 [Nephila pilipes]|uniref:Structural maintenance of chromosomes protein 5 n=1 Tax=Nephila pilipes TaxID=299642 RepID=A0A8X6TJG2_NEPPI|nr:structural maintenance of chromosomes protein 5 [Nephila pilipes]
MNLGTRPSCGSPVVMTLPYRTVLILVQGRGLPYGGLPGTGCLLQHACWMVILCLICMWVVLKNVNMLCLLFLWCPSNVIAEYKEREQKIYDAEKKIQVHEDRKKDLVARIKVKKKIWLYRLMGHIENINKKFSEYYKFLQCAGEISLDTADDSDDFPNYGLQIKLKYRVDEDFIELSQTHHSGGECSVAAIIFILSLQELTEVPFRCIDEINQGMDAVNERKMYHLVADAAKSGSCSQYFLLTPKLLMDLSYHKDVAVHIIYNSSFLQTKLDVKKHLEIAKRCKR